MHSHAGAPSPLVVVQQPEEEAERRALKHLGVDIGDQRPQALALPLGLAARRLHDSQGSTTEQTEERQPSGSFRHVARVLRVQTRLRVAPVGRRCSLRRR